MRTHADAQHAQDICVPVRQPHAKALGKVLHVATLPPPIGGMTTYFKGLIESGIAEKFQQLVVRSDVVNKYRYRGLKRFIMNLLNVPALCGALIVSLIRYRPDIVHIQSNSGAGFFEKTLLAFFSRLFACVVLLHMHGGGFRHYYQSSSKIMQWFIRRCISLNHFIIAPSQAMHNTFLDIGVSPERVKLLENAVNVPPESIWDHRGIGTDGNGLTGDVTVLFFNSITRAKGIFEFVDAAVRISRELPRVFFRIAGIESPDTIMVKKQIQEYSHSFRIHLIGPLTEAEKYNELQKADIYVLPSHIEDLPYGLLDAMALGLPCIASAVGAVPSLIEDGKNGLLVPPRDTVLLTEAIRRAVTDPLLRRRLGIAGRALIQKRYSWQQRSEQIKEFYQSIIENASELSSITLH